MEKRTRSGAAAYRWKSAMETYDDPELHGVEYYPLPDPNTEAGPPSGPQKVIEGDRYFHTEDRYMIEVVGVRTKIYQGVVAPQGEEGEDYVFYTTDWNPPRSRSMFHEPHHPHRDDEPFSTDVQEFANAIEDGTLIPHRGNGITLPP